MAMLSTTVRCGKSPACWMTYPMPRRSSAGGTVAVSRSSSQMRPLVGSIIRLIIRRLVVLPQPDGPTRTVIWPDGASRSRWSTATVPSG